MTYYPNDPPLMWLREGWNVSIVGCTACPWTTITRPGGDQWRRSELAYQTHLVAAHGASAMAPDDPRHGTYAGYRAHYRVKENPCGACAAARLDYEMSYGAEMRPDDHRHGTAYGYRAHYRTGSKPCEACAEAYSVYQKAYYQRRKAAAA